MGEGLRGGPMTSEGDGQPMTSLLVEWVSVTCRAGG